MDAKGTNLPREKAAYKVAKYIKPRTPVNKSQKKRGLHYHAATSSGNT